MDLLDDFLQNLQRFENSVILRNWAIQNGLADNIHVLARLRELELAETRQQVQRNDYLWKLVVDSFTSESELINFAENANYLDDRYVQRRLDHLRQV